MTPRRALEKVLENFNGDDPISVTAFHLLEEDE
jgi:hypothetical protein